MEDRTGKEEMTTWRGKGQKKNYGGHRKGKRFTEQGRDTPVLVGAEGVGTGPCRPSANDCPTSPVANQADGLKNATGFSRGFSKGERSVDPFQRRGNVGRSPPPRPRLGSAPAKVLSLAEQTINPVKLKDYATCSPLKPQLATDAVGKEINFNLPKPVEEKGPKIVYQRPANLMDPGMEIHKIIEEERLAFEGLGKNLDIINNIVKEARNIHKQIREATVAAVIFYQRLQEARKARETAQSDPLIVQPTGKRFASASPEFLTPSKQRLRTRQGSARDQNQASGNKTSIQTTEETDSDDPEWKTVDHRKRKKKKEGEKTQTQQAGHQQNAAAKRNPRSRRPEAVAVKPKDASCSYAEMLKAIKAKVDPEAIGVKITKIRQTRNGEVLIEIAKGGGKADELKAAVAQALGEDASVRNMAKQSITIEIRDIDGATDEEEVVSAIKTATPGYDLETMKVRALRKTFGETQMAVITMPVVAANVVLKAGKLKIGWIMCRIRERRQTLQCFRCLSFGHMAKDCSGPDRSRLCRLCGKEGHFAKECKEEPYCVVCGDEKEPGGAKHILGSARCEPRRREAKQAKK